jgi:hypothetical protein
MAPDLSIYYYTSDKSIAAEHRRQDDGATNAGVDSKVS